MEFYNLSKDPREQNNIADRHPHILKKLHRKMKEAHSTPEIDKFNMEDK